MQCNTCEPPVLEYVDTALFQVYYKTARNSIFQGVL